VQRLAEVAPGVLAATAGYATTTTTVVAAADGGRLPGIRRIGAMRPTVGAR
jgi:hypothetical protein